MGRPADVRGGVRGSCTGHESLPLADKKRHSFLDGRKFDVPGARLIACPFVLPSMEVHLFQHGPQKTVAILTLHIERIATVASFARN